MSLYLSKPVQATKDPVVSILLYDEHVPCISRFSLLLFLYPSSADWMFSVYASDSVWGCRGGQLIIMRKHAFHWSIIIQKQGLVTFNSFSAPVILSFLPCHQIDLWCCNFLDLAVTPSWGLHKKPQGCLFKMSMLLQPFPRTDEIRGHIMLLVNSQYHTYYY
jgi:hypothetical protein